MTGYSEKLYDFSCMDEQNVQT